MSNNLIPILDAITNNLQYVVLQHLFQHYDALSYYKMCAILREQQIY